MRRQRGDTIVEVMIAAAIIGLVIAISYATSSRALRAGRQAQERTEAYKYVESQLEQLKLMADTNVKSFGLDTSKPVHVSNQAASVYSDAYDRNPAGGSQSFCLSTVSGTLQVIPQDMIVVDQYVDPGDNYDLVASSTGAPTGAETYHKDCAVGADGRYKMSIERADSTIFAQTVSVFTVRARWQRVGGGKDEVKVVYRLNRGQFTP